MKARIHAALDRAALAMIEVLEDTSKDEQGRAKVSLRDRMAAMSQATDWLNRREKLGADGEKDDAGIDALRDLMSDPESVVERLQVNPAFIAALRKRGWLPPEPKLKGRPTKPEAELRAERGRRETMAKREVGDDSILQELLPPDLRH